MLSAVIGVREATRGASKVSEKGNWQELEEDQRTNCPEQIGFKVKKFAACTTLVSSLLAWQRVGGIRGDMGIPFDIRHFAAHRGLR